MSNSAANPVRKAVIPAAGFGTRFLPFTKAVPKEMLPIIDKPTIHFVVEEAVAAGIDQILLVISRDKRTIEDYFDRNPNLDVREGGRFNAFLPGSPQPEGTGRPTIQYVRQPAMGGLADALRCAQSFVGREPFAVLLGDTILDGATPAIGQLAQVHARHGGSVLGLERVAPEAAHRYGVIRPGDPVAQEGSGSGTWPVVGLIEKPPQGTAPSDLAVAARYILTADFFDHLPAPEPGLPTRELTLTEVLDSMLEARCPLWGHLIEGHRYDIGDKTEYLKTILDYALREDTPYAAPLLAHLVARHGITIKSS